MKTNGLRRVISVAALTLVMLLGVVVGASTSAEPQHRDYGHERQGNWDRERTREYGFLLGYHNSYSQGKNSGERGQRVNHSNMQEYREGTNGFLTWMGDRNTYRDNYRRGFAMGFRDGQEGRSRRHTKQDVERVLGATLKEVYNDDRYDRDELYDRGRRDGGRRDRDDNGQLDDYGRYDGNDVYRVAQQNGHRDGLRQGREDRGRRRASRYEHLNEFRDALRGYRSEHGDRDRYRQAYREGYRRGYEEGNRRDGN